MAVTAAFTVTSMASSTVTPSAPYANQVAVRVKVPALGFRPAFFGHGGHSSPSSCLSCILVCFSVQLRLSGLFRCKLKWEIDNSVVGFNSMRYFV